MVTLEKSPVREAHSSPKVGGTWYQRLIKDMEGAYFGIVAMSIVIATILGAIALMYIFKNKAPLWQVFVSIALVLSNIIIPVAQQKLTWIIALFITSALVNSLLIIVNAFL